MGKIEKHKDGKKRIRVGNKIMGTLPNGDASGKNNKDILRITNEETNKDGSADSVEDPQNFLHKKLFNKITARALINEEAAEQIRYYQQLNASLNNEKDTEINIMYAVDADDPTVGYREAHMTIMPDGSCLLKTVTYGSSRSEGEEGEESLQEETINLSKEQYLPNCSAVERAEALSYDAHFGQADKLGVPYYHHPAGVAKYLVTLPEYEQLSDAEKDDAVVAAWLHDTVEDTPIDAEVLRYQRFSEGAIAAVVALTMKKNETRNEYYERILSSGRVARAVKLADLGHNTLPSRRETLPGSPSNPVSSAQSDAFARLGRKYAKAFKALGADIPKHLRQYA